MEEMGVYETPLTKYLILSLVDISQITYNIPFSSQTFCNHCENQIYSYNNKEIKHRGIIKDCNRKENWQEIHTSIHTKFLTCVILSLIAIRSLFDHKVILGLHFIN